MDASNSRRKGPSQCERRQAGRDETPEVQTKTTSQSALPV